MIPPHSRLVGRSVPRGTSSRHPVRRFFRMSTMSGALGAGPSRNCWHTDRAATAITTVAADSSAPTDASQPVTSRRAVAAKLGSTWAVVRYVRHAMRSVNVPARLVLATQHGGPRSRGHTPRVTNFQTVGFLNGGSHSAAKSLLLRRRRSRTGRFPASSNRLGRRHPPNEDLGTSR